MCEIATYSESSPTFSTVIYICLWDIYMGYSNRCAMVAHSDFNCDFP